MMMIIIIINNNQDKDNFFKKEEKKDSLHDTMKQRTFKDVCFLLAIYCCGLLFRVCFFSETTLEEKSQSFIEKCD